MRRSQYGKWYIKPSTWQERLNQELDTLRKDEKVDTVMVTNVKHDQDPAKSDVSHLHSTKAFGEYLAMKKYKRPSFIKFVNGYQ